VSEYSEEEGAYAAQNSQPPPSHTDGDECRRNRKATARRPSHSGAVGAARSKRFTRAHLTRSGCALAATPPTNRSIARLLLFVACVSCRVGESRFASAISVKLKNNVSILFNLKNNVLALQNVVFLTGVWRESSAKRESRPSLPNLPVLPCL
jgi:hypothetical protein